MESPATTKKTSAGTIAIAWLVVLIPLGWGVYTSVSKSLPLFQAGTTPRPKPGPAGVPPEPGRRPVPG